MVKKKKACETAVLACCCINDTHLLFFLAKKTTFECLQPQQQISGQCIPVLFLNKETFFFSNHALIHWEVFLIGVCLTSR